MLIVLLLAEYLSHLAQGFTIQHGYTRSRTPPFGALSSAVNRLGLTENFNRWRYLQRLLDEEVEAHDVNEVLFILLDNYKRRVEQDPDESTAPERTLEVLERIERLLQPYDGSLPVLQDPACTPGDQHVLMQVELLLPDPVEKEEAFQGAWDTVLELHGKASVTANERAARPEWKAVFLIARVMIYFDFLTGEGLEVPSSIG